MMNFHTMTDQAIAAEIGQRIEQMRLEQNITQQQIADEVGLSRLSYRNLIKGNGKFENIVAVLRALGQLDLVEAFIPKTAFSPMAQLKYQGKERKRATGLKSSQPGKTIQPDSELDW
ncbi:helix-turn-helix domain-containing protein [Aliikangiella sp. IMCC44359]|uniref:helix-turn-helix domain-containing protein n=1 Tax=Aliikangiella sp. IMCC44359 TaxID=3459125 RepID=UPI00403AFC93